MFKIMHPIFKEFTYRCFYTLIFILLNLIYVYVSLGFQYEYFSSVFNHDYQNADFCCATVGLEPCTIATQFRSALCINHTSLSWNGLDFSNLLYFYNLDLGHANCNMFVGLYDFLIVSSYVSIQGVAFALPGTFAFGRRHFICFLALSLVLPFLVLNMVFEYVCFYAELQFETYDSELFGHASGFVSNVSL